MFIVLLTKKTVQIIYFVIKTHNFFHYFHIFLQKYRKGKNDNNLQILHVRKI